MRQRSPRTCGRSPGTGKSWQASSSAPESAEENPDYGYIAQLGVRPAYRRRGLGEALLRQSFVQFHQADRAGVLLFVDAQSLTGATRLYERVGMASQPRFATWEKELRPGDRAEADG